MWHKKTLGKAVSGCGEGSHRSFQDGGCLCMEHEQACKREESVSTRGNVYILTALWVQAGDVAQLTECLSGTCQALASVLAL